jgi:hypothetical protein
MATIYRDFPVDTSAEEAWTAVRDLGAVHTRLAVGFVADSKLEGDTRTVTFANGFTIREKIVAVDEKLMRFAYAATGGLTNHHNASFQVFPVNDKQCRMLWITDLLPDEVAPKVTDIVDNGIKAIQATLKK